MLSIKLKDKIRCIVRSAGNKLVEISNALEADKFSPSEEAEPANNNQDDLYYSDHPISTRKDDLFNRASFASRIAETIAIRNDSTSIVLGIYGSWGDGKTSVLEMMSEALEDYKNVITIKFNPWLFQSEELLLRAFFSSLAQGLGRSLPSVKEKIGKILDNYGSALSLTPITVGGFVSINPAEAVRKIGEKLSQTDIEKERCKIEAILEENKLRVVVFVDDIDRLDKDETHAVFKLVKLSASFRYTSYVLAFDYNVVSASLGDRYGDGGQEAGSAFLEKIIQVPLHLPPADELSLRQLAFQGVNAALNMAEIAIEQKSHSQFTMPFIEGFQQKLTTPRLAKRYGNALLFSLPLLKGEVNPIDLMLVEGIRVFYPEVYIFIRDNPTFFLEGLKDNYKHISSSEDAFSNFLKEKLPTLLSGEIDNLKSGVIEALFPRTTRMQYGNEWDLIWAKEQKICSSQYFSKYFMYSIPKETISDNVFLTTISSFNRFSEAEQDSILIVFSEQNVIPNFIMKLRQNINRLSEETAKNLIYTFARNSQLIPREQGFMNIGGTWTQAGILISHLMLKIDINDRFQMIKSLFDNTPINFCLEMWRWLCHYKDKPEGQRVLSDTDGECIVNILAKKISIEDSMSPIYKTNPQDIPSLYWTWKHGLGADSVKEALTHHLNKSPGDVDIFLECFVGEGWVLDTRQAIRSAFERNDYDNISGLIDATFVFEKLKKLYGDELDYPQYYRDDTNEFFSDSRMTAHQFAHIHKLVTQEQEKKETSSSEQDG